VGIEQSMRREFLVNHNLAQGSFVMLFAEASGSNFHFLLFVLIMVMGTRQICIWMKGNPQLRDASKKAGGGLLRWLLKK
jgi:hypothetical protein